MHFQYRPPDRAFLGEEGFDRPPEEARAVVVPFGLEASVTYAPGTRNGPEAIIAASPMLDMFDEDFRREVHRDYGIATLEPFEVPASIPEALNQLEDIVETLLEQGKFPLTLGGEHSLTAGAIRPFARRYPDLMVLQIDAHADLRDGYQGEHYSHAAAMRRVLDHAHVGLVTVGVRSICTEEFEFLEANRSRIAMHWGRDRRGWRIEDIVAPLKGKPVYVTFDLDGLDPSVLPATGTPVPGGLLWDEAIDILDAAARAGTIVGADVVELSPREGSYVSDFTAAKLAHKIMAFALARA